ncbi:YfbM family protein [uncultured Mailhella sp.]|uniref:YfbM family protein n=1 Tax=uncultured Mailhella sp. TaxID=1981031 RepID=UPI00320847D6
MAMTGNYFRTDEYTVDEIRRGVLDLADVVDADEDHVLDVDRAWHAIQFTLNGAASGGDPDNVFSRLVLSGNTLFDDDDEFAARLIAPGDVKELAAALEDLTWEDVRGRFSVSDMLDQNIYPVTEEENEDEFFDYVWSYLSDMKDFFDDAAAEGQAVIFYMP